MILILTIHLPVPKAIFGSRTPSFAFLVSLCEALAIVNTRVAIALRLVNSLRNKCAHRGAFSLDEGDSLAELSKLVGEIAGEECAPDSELEFAFTHLSSVLEERATGMGVVTIDADLVAAPAEGEEYW